MLIDPPTEGVDTLAAPKPRWVWMLEATSVRPAQLDQYTPPHSMSFIETPLTSTATFSLLKPRMFTFVSP